MLYQLQLQEELERRVKANRIKWFNPNGKQEEYIDLVGEGKVFVAVFSAGNGVGKTALMVNTAGNIIYGEKTENPWFLKYNFFKNFPFVHRGRIASTKKNVEEVGAIQTEIKNWFPKDTYKTKKNGKIYDSEYQIGDWVFDIMTYEQDTTEFESATLGFMIFDEPPPQRILNACIARMRKGGIIMIFMTPLDSGGDLLEELSEHVQIEQDGVVLGKVGIVYADIEDNCKEHGVRGQLEHSHIAQMISFYDADEREARAKGKPSHLVGRIYSEFECESPYVVEDFEIKDDWVCVQVVDPHDAKPFAVTYAAIDQTGQIWIYDEYPLEDLDKVKSTSLNYPDYKRIFAEREGRRHINFRILDPYFGNKTFGNTGLSPKQELYNLGLDYDDGDTSGIDLGHKRVQEFLRYNKKLPVNSLNHPRLHIMKRCRNHWRSMSKYKTKINKSGEVKDKVVIEETYKHFCDNIRHLVMKFEEVRYSKSATPVNFDNLAGAGRGGW